MLENIKLGRNPLEGFKVIFEANSAMVHRQLERDHAPAESFKTLENLRSYGNELFSKGEMTDRWYMILHIGFASLLSKGDYGAFDPCRLQNFNCTFNQPESFKGLLMLLKEKKINPYELDYSWHWLGYNCTFLPIVSRTGHFAFKRGNKAYTHEIAPVGCPLSESSFDGILNQSPIKFLGHDLNHAARFGIFYEGNNDNPTPALCQSFKGIYIKMEPDKSSKDTLEDFLYHLLVHEDFVVGLPFRQNAGFSEAIQEFTTGKKLYNRFPNELRDVRDFWCFLISEVVYDKKPRFEIANIRVIGLESIGEANMVQYSLVSDPENFSHSAVSPEGSWASTYREMVDMIALLQGWGVIKDLPKDENGRYLAKDFRSILILEMEKFGQKYKGDGLSH